MFWIFALVIRFLGLISWCVLRAVVWWFSGWIEVVFILRVGSWVVGLCFGDAYMVPGGLGLV